MRKFFEDKDIDNISISGCYPALSGVHLSNKASGHGAWIPNYRDKDNMEFLSTLEGNTKVPELIKQKVLEYVEQNKNEITFKEERVRIIREGRY